MISETLSPRPSTMSSLFQQPAKQCAFNLYSVWLFTLSDLKTIVLPSTAFGLVNAIALSLNHTPTLPAPSEILHRTPLVLLWVWINLLPFAINNQRQPAAILEDGLNKPWRPMPSRRLSPTAAKRLMLVAYPLAVLGSLCLGNLAQSLTLILLGYWYNDLHGGDASCLVRNLINAGGFLSFASGALQAAIGARASALPLLGWWSLVIAAIVFSTVQTQDMYDQRGDAVRNRRTVPLVVGDAPARWTIAVPMVVWCWATPWLWRSSTLGYVAPVALGLTVAVRTLKERSERGDRNTFRIWNLWMVSVYLLPLIKASEGLLQEGWLRNV
jgi:4-hydroxybenzoate polyprenyltransferase